MRRVFFIALAGIIDSVMVSSLGTQKVASIGLTVQPRLLALSLFVAVNVSTAALAARRRGEEDREGANRILLQALLVTVTAGLLIGGVCFAFAGVFMRIVGSDSSSHADAVLYFRIVMGGMLFYVLSLSINAALRGIGSTRAVMVINISGNCLHILLNWFLIQGRCGVPAMGVAGAAVSYLLGTILSCAMGLFCVLRPSAYLNLTYIWKNRIRPRKDSFFVMCRLSVSCCLEQLLIRVGLMATSVMAADLGTQAMASHQLGMNLINISYAFGDGLQAAAVALIGQSLGRKRPDQARQFGTICQRLGFLSAIALMVFYLLSCIPLFRRCFPGNAECLRDGYQILSVLVVLVFIETSQMVYCGCLRGAGDILYVTFVSVFSMVFVRTVTGYVFCYTAGLGLLGLWISILIDQIFRLLLSYPRYRGGKWVNLKL